MQNTIDAVDKNTQAVQVQLKMLWRSMLHQGLPLPTFDDVQFRTYSQNGEDGILLYLFTLLGTTNKKVLEICAGNGQECCSANLIINHGWEGFLVDGDEENVASGIEFYKNCRDTRQWPPKFRQAWITRDNVNQLVSSFNLSGEIDLLSIDLDGNDYWIFDALDVVQPRVVIVEYQQGWGPEKSITQRYEEDFQHAKYKEEHPGQAFCGASLAALVKAAKRKGLRLVGCERKCFNAIFVRDGLGEDTMPTVSPAACFDHVMARYNVAWLPERIDASDPFWVSV